MRRRILYSWLIIFVIILIANFFLIRKMAMIKLVPQEVKPPEETETNFPSVVALSHSASGATPGITIVKKPSPQEVKTPLTPTEEAENTLENPDQRTHNLRGPSGRNTAPAVEAEASPTTPAPASGITKINNNKYPTEVEKKEMISRGIILY